MANSSVSSTLSVALEETLDKIAHGTGCDRDRLTLLLVCPTHPLLFFASIAAATLGTRNERPLRT
jgi:hypothetical protein